MWLKLVEIVKLLSWSLVVKLVILLVNVVKLVTLQVLRMVVFVTCAGMCLAVSCSIFVDFLACGCRVAGLGLLGGCSFFL